MTEMVHNYDGIFYLQVIKILTKVERLPEELPFLGGVQLGEELLIGGFLQEIS